MKRGVYFGGSMEAIEFGFFPIEGLRLKGKIKDWLEVFQKLYVSPYEEFLSLDPDSHMAEKRLVGVLHELLRLFVENSAEGKKILCLKKHLGLKQKVHKAFERHPNIFYLSSRNKTCTAILKEAYGDPSATEEHPLLGVGKKYLKLMKESDLILKKRRSGNHLIGHRNFDFDLDDEE